MRANPFGLDDRIWNRVKTMTRGELDAYAAAHERFFAAHRHAVQSTLRVTEVWARHRDAATLAELRTLVAGDPRAVMLIETATSDWRRVGALESDLIARGWRDADERSVLLDPNGELALIQAGEPRS